jgi:hypothetical protein
MTRVCRECTDEAMSWQPNCEAHRYVGEVLEAEIDVELPICTRHLTCSDGERTETWRVTAEVASDPIEEEFLISEIVVMEPKDADVLFGRPLYDAEWALMGVANARLDARQKEALPYAL